MAEYDRTLVAEHDRTLVGEHNRTLVAEHDRVGIPRPRAGWGEGTVLGGGQAGELGAGGHVHGDLEAGGQDLAHAHACVEKREGGGEGG